MPRIFVIAAVLGLITAGTAAADDAHAEMAAALAAQADLHPSPVALPTTAAAPRQAAAPSAVRRGIDPRAAAMASARGAEQLQLHGAPHVLAHQVQAAAATAAGQAQAQAARQRVDRPRPVPHR
jgi:hypothetical protein